MKALSLALVALAALGCTPPIDDQQFTCLMGAPRACPAGFMCVGGLCTNRPPPDAAPPDEDAGPLEDAGADAGTDAGVDAGPLDAGPLDAGPELLPLGAVCAISTDCESGLCRAGPDRGGATICTVDCTASNSCAEGSCIEYDPMTPFSGCLRSCTGNPDACHSSNYCRPIQVPAVSPTVSYCVPDAPQFGDGPTCSRGVAPGQQGFCPVPDSCAVASICGSSGTHCGLCASLCAGDGDCGAGGVCLEVVQGQPMQCLRGCEGGGGCGGSTPFCLEQADDTDVCVPTEWTGQTLPLPAAT